MNIRPFGWRDLTLLHGYLDQGLFLDSTRVLIHGRSLIPVGVFVPFLGPSMRIYTYHCDNDSHTGRPLLGQITYQMGSTYARLSFLAPEDAVELPELSTLSDFLAAEMGEKGVFHILADVDETSQVFRMLHKAGFAIYARQRIWRLDGQPLGVDEPVTWRRCKSTDTIPARSLYCNVVPGLVQQIEPLPKSPMKGVVNYKNGDLLAYVELKHGRIGIWMQPFIHPDAGEFDRALVNLLKNLPGRGNRPLYLCIRSYQSWLEPAIQAMGGVPGPAQAVMVRHLAVTRPALQAHPVPAINGKHVETSVPIARMGQAQYLEPSHVDDPSRAKSTS